MNTLSVMPNRKLRFIITWMSLIIAITACGGGNGGGTSIPEAHFEYQVRVQEKGGKANLSSAQVRIEVSSQAPLTAVTDNNGTARIFIDSSIEGKPARLIVEASGFENYEKNIDLQKELLPTIIQLEPSHAGTSVLDLTPVAPITAERSKQITPDEQSTCSWVSYLNGKPVRDLSNSNCLNDLIDIGISGTSQKISFFVKGGLSGTYGVCKDISKNNNLILQVKIKDSIVAARFLITVGPEPIPNISSYAFRIQPQDEQNQQKKIYLKFINYTSSGFIKELDETIANSNWKSLDTWNFDVDFHFSGAKATAKVNEMPAPFTWSLEPGSRYLCLSFEATPTSSQSSEIETHVIFP